MIWRIYESVGVVTSYLLVYLLGVGVGKEMYKRFLDSIGKDQFGNEKKK